MLVSPIINAPAGPPGRRDPAVYRQVTELLAVSPGQISFADDSAGNVEAALACGWNPVRYRSPGDLGALTG